MDKTEFPEGYLSTINDMIGTEPCIYKTLLKLWQKDKKSIEKLTKKEILRDISMTLQNK